MNNLDMMQEAAIVGGAGEAIPLDFGPMQAAVYKAAVGWFVAIAGDPLQYRFETMGEACDFVCAEARLLS